MNANKPFPTLIGVDDTGFALIQRQDAAGFSAGHSRTFISGALFAGPVLDFPRMGTSESDTHGFANTKGMGPYHQPQNICGICTELIDY